MFPPRQRADAVEPFQDVDMGLQRQRQFLAVERVARTAREVQSSSGARSDLQGRIPAERPYDAAATF